MKKLSTRIVPALVLACLAPAAASADGNRDLTAYFSKKIGQMRGSLAKMENSPDDPSMELKAINIDIAPSVSFGISRVLSLTVEPEIDFVLVPEKMELK